jgi:hypothetical protein
MREKRKKHVHKQQWWKGKKVELTKTTEPTAEDIAQRIERKWWDIYNRTSRAVTVEREK